MKNQVIIGQKRTLATRKAIMDAAVEAFSKYSYQEVSIRDIADNAMVHHANIRYHFGSKEDLWSEVLKVIFESLNVISSELDFSTGGDPKVVLKNHIVKVIKNVIDNPGVLHIYHSETFVSVKENKILQPYLRHLYSFVMKEIKLMQEYGFGKDIALEEFYFIYTSAINVRFLHREIHELLTGKKGYDDALINRHAEAIVTLLSPKD